jgi:hypothetical protein
MGTFDNVNIPGPLSQVVINQNGAGTITFGAAVAGQTVKLFRLVLTSSTVTNTLLFQSSGGTARTGVMSLALGIPFELNLTNCPWYTSIVGESLQLVVANAGQVSGSADIIQS